MEATDVAGIGGGFLTLGYFGRLAIERFVNRADAAQVLRESERDKASLMTVAGINALKQGFADLKSDIRLMGSQVEQTRGQHIELKDRINGGLSAHKVMLEDHENRLTVLETTIRSEARIASLEKQLVDEKAVAPTPPNPRRRKK